MMTTPIFCLCSGRMFSRQRNSVQLFKSCAGANMIKPITCNVVWLVRVVLLKDCPDSLIVIFTSPLKKKAMFCTKALATNPFSSTFMNCWLWFYYWFRRTFLSEIPPIRKQDKSEGFDSCDQPSNLTQIGFKSSIFQPVWPWKLMDDP